MNKPRWQEVRDDLCQWPRCSEDGQVHYSEGATKWIDHPDGVWLCMKHLSIMNDALFPEPVGPEIGSTVTLKEKDGFPAERVVVLDWWYDLGVILSVDDGSDTPTEVPFSECEEAS